MGKFEGDLFGTADRCGFDLSFETMELMFLGMRKVRCTTEKDDAHC